MQNSQGFNIDMFGHFWRAEDLNVDDFQMLWHGYVVHRNHICIITYSLL